MASHRKTRAFVNLSHLRANIRFLRKLNGESAFFCPMVKANAYGHGDVEISKALQECGVRRLGVGQVEEGLRLRQAGIDCEILCFSYVDEVGADLMLENQLSPVVMDVEQLQLFGSLAQVRLSKKPESGPVSIHLKFDTGMNRMGFSTQDRSVVLKQISSYQKTLKVQSVLTHLKQGEDAHDLHGATFQQLTEFKDLIDGLQSQGLGKWSKDFQVHALNSSALLQKQDLQRNLVAGWDLGSRPGLAVYGYSPLTGLSRFLKPVLSLQSEWVNLRSVSAGQTVSYGGTWTAKIDSWIGVLPCGYADGYSRRLSNRSSVLIMGKRAPVVGNVCMDYVMIDVTELVLSHGLEVVRGSAVTLLGEDEHGNIIGAHELASWAGTIPWEILTSIKERVPRISVDKETSS